MFVILKMITIFKNVYQFERVFVSAKDVRKIKKCSWNDGKMFQKFEQRSWIHKKFSDFKKDDGFQKCFGIPKMFPN